MSQSTFSKARFKLLLMHNIFIFLLSVQAAKTYVEDLQLSPTVYNDLVEAVKYSKISACINLQQGQLFKNTTQLREDCLSFVDEDVGKCKHMKFLKIMTHKEEGFDNKLTAKDSVTWLNQDQNYGMAPEVSGLSPLLENVPKGRNKSVSEDLISSLAEPKASVNVRYKMQTGQASRKLETVENTNDQKKETVILENKVKFTNKGYLAIDEKQKRVVLVFNGSKTWIDWLVDLTIMLVPYKPLTSESKQEGRSKSGYFENYCQNQKCKIHKGFLHAMKSLYKKHHKLIINTLNEHPKYQFWICGHSLGGAMAILTGVEFKLLGYEPIIITAGSPKVGNKATSTFIDQLFETEKAYYAITQSNMETYESTKKENGLFARVRHLGDSVPKLPMGNDHYLYKHAGVEFCITKKDLPHPIETVKVVQRDYSKDDEHDEEEEDQKEKEDKNASYEGDFGEKKEGYEGKKESARALSTAVSHEKRFSIDAQNAQRNSHQCKSTQEKYYFDENEDFYQDEEEPYEKEAEYMDPSELGFEESKNVTAYLIPRLRRKAHAEYFIVITNCRKREEYSNKQTSN